MESKFSRSFSYDGQLVRAMKIFGAKALFGYQVTSGTQADGKKRNMVVPVVYGSMSRTVQYIIGHGTENVVPRLPVMSFIISDMQRNANRAQSPTFTDQRYYRKRATDGDGNLIPNQPGKFVTLERTMPVPYDVNVAVAIWSSNIDQQYQLVEQIITRFNPDQEIALSSSPYDWTSPTSVIFNGTVNFEEATQSTNPDPFIVGRMSFIVRLLISLPAKTYDSTLIHEVDVDIRELERPKNECLEEELLDTLDFETMPELTNFIIEASPDEIIEMGGQ